MLQRDSTSHDEPGHGGSPITVTLDAILRADDVETVWSLLRKAMLGYGFDGIIYGYSPNSFGPSLGAREDFFVLSTLARAATEEMLDRGFFTQSITFNHALRHVGLCSWSITPDEAGMPDFIAAPEALDFFERNGMVAGCSIGFPIARTRGRAAMSLIARAGLAQDAVDAVLASCADELFVIATVVHRSLITLPFRNHRRALGDRQREVLEWVAEGKSVADIAGILNLSQVTVEKHLRLARERLGVTTTAHALIKAAFLNQMFTTPPGGGKSSR